MHNHHFPTLYHIFPLLRLRKSLFFSEVKYIANGIYKFTQVLTIFGTKLIKLAAGKQIINSNSTKKRFTVASKPFAAATTLSQYFISSSLGCG